MEKTILLRTMCASELEGSLKEILDVQKTIVLERSCAKLVQKTRANKLMLFGFDHIQGAFLSTCFLARGLVLFQQFVDDAGSLESKKQDLKVAQSASVDSATGPLQHHQFELAMDGKVNLGTFSMQVSPHDRVVMHKARGVM